MNQLLIRIGIFFLIAAFIAYHIFTLSYSPVPWFDEVWFVSMTKSWLDNKTFHLLICPLQTTKEMLFYGPVYFILTSCSIDLFDWGIFQYRIVNFSFGIGCLIVSFFILKKYITNYYVLALFISMYAMDTIFSQNIHCGRMDSVALFFVLFSVYLLLKEEKDRYYILSGLFIALAILTTARAGILLVSVFLLLIYRLYINFNLQNIKRLTLLGIAFLIPCILWINFGYGGFEEFIKYYSEYNQDVNGEKKSLLVYMGGGFVTPKYHYPLMACFIGLFILYVIKKYNKITVLLFISFVNVILFHLFVDGHGLYSVFILPFIYFLISYICNDHSIISKKLAYFILGSLLFINLSIFLLKSISVLTSIDQRDYNKFDQFVDLNIPDGSKVVGNDMYYYSVIKNKNNYETIERGLNDSLRVDHHLNKYNFDYLIVNEQYELTHIELLQLYKNRGNLVKIANITLNSNSSIGEVILKLGENFLGQPLVSTYSGSIYKRERR